MEVESMNVTLYSWLCLYSLSEIDEINRLLSEWRGAGIVLNDPYAFFDRYKIYVQLPNDIVHEPRRITPYLLALKDVDIEGLENAKTYGDGKDVTRYVDFTLIVRMIEYGVCPAKFADTVKKVVRSTSGDVKNPKGYLISTVLKKLLK